ncbi:MAG: hypothetical protein JRC93_13235 [Deltaproteobacteria bacterium]|nr:hypothetical protein [Deltaproteobacteria bacterium]
MDLLQTSIERSACHYQAKHPYGKEEPGRNRRAGKSKAKLLLDTTCAYSKSLDKELVRDIWLTEAKRRRDEVRSSQVKPISGIEAMESVRKIIL